MRFVQVVHDLSIFFRDTINCLWNVQNQGKDCNLLWVERKRKSWNNGASKRREALRQAVMNRHTSTEGTSPKYRKQIIKILKTVDIGCLSVKSKELFKIQCLWLSVNTEWFCFPWLLVSYGVIDQASVRVHVPGQLAKSLHNYSGQGRDEIETREQLAVSIPDLKLKR